MVDFNYLKHNESDFPHLGNVDVFKYDNDFDYGRFDATQMELQICSVPWDVGEAHVGQRTISGIGNVVYFDTKEKRDAWFDAIPDNECYRFTTKFKELHRSLQIDVPIPYDMCAKHNYLVVKYAKFANDNSPVQYEGENGLRKWFWFIREVEFLAPNTTRLHLLDDAFQTWIYDIYVSGMILERGHAPMMLIKTDEYLSNPLNKCDYLLTEDVNFGNASIVKHAESCVFNDGTMYACFAVTSNPTGNWGTKAADTWKVPSAAFFTQQGQPSVYVFCMQAGNLNTFLQNVSANFPQFKQTVQAVWFASNKLITLGDAFEFAGISCYRIQAVRKSLDFITLDKSQFGYPAQYADMAKLYTSPYAQIEVTDENGNTDVVKIEDSTGVIKINAAMNTAYPFITIDAQLSGMGGNFSHSITFKNINNRSFGMSGQWYETIRTWQVPTFAVVLDPAREYDYSSHFDRLQRAVEYNATRQNAYDSADMEQGNTYRTADVEKTNAYNNAGVLRTNAALNVSTNEAVTAETNRLGNIQRYDNEKLNDDLRDAHNELTDEAATATIDAANQQAAITATAGAVSAANGAISAAASGNPAGAVSSLVNGLVGIGTTLASNSVGVALTATQAEITKGSTTVDTVGANDLILINYFMQRDTANYLTGITGSGGKGKQNLYIEGVADNNADVMEENADNTEEMQQLNADDVRLTARGNANRDRNTAISGVENDVAQAALRAPFVFGSFESGDTSTTRPIALIANVVTQSKAAIASAGDEFARYGYMLNRQWPFDGNWNVGKYFTYWKLRDFWVYNLNVPDLYMDKIRFFLFGGVTVWRKPEYIGKINIYDNMQ